MIPSPSFVSVRNVKKMHPLRKTNVWALKGISFESKPQEGTHFRLVMPLGSRLVTPPSLQ